jgi:serine/threonine protein kinase
VRLYEVLDDASVDKLYIIMELVKNGSLGSAILKNKSIDVMTLWKYFREMVQGLLYCKKVNLFTVSIVHETCGIVHRDIKPDNILLDENDRIKYTDFGLSLFTEGDDNIVNNAAGSTCFFSPEVTHGKSYNAKSADVWALGVTLYYMVFRKYPFQPGRGGKPELFAKIQNDT